MKKLLISALIICSSFSYAQVPDDSENFKNTNVENISWIKPPSIKYAKRDLKGQDRQTIVRIEVNSDGRVVMVSFIQTSGIKELDSKIAQAMMPVKFTPYVENGIAHPFKLEKKIILKLSDAERP